MKKKAIIIGASKNTSSDFLKKHTDEFIIAADGGYQLCRKENIEPDILIGDFDTLDTSLIQHPKSITKLNPIKDDTDTFFAVKYLLEKGYDEIHFYGCLGGKLEHTIGNIQILSYLLNHNAKGYLHSEDDSQVTFMIENDSFEFKKNVKGMVSIFSYTEEANDVTIEHMKYNLSHGKLDQSFPLGVSNEFLTNEKETGKVSVANGKLLIIAPADSVF